ncbi:MAG: CARDB domain-containing protein [Lacipirellulaceae bacterium]
MQRITSIALGLALATVSLQQANAAESGLNQQLPKVDYAIGRIKPVGQGFAIPVTNRGFAMSPQTTISVVIYNAQNRQLLATKNLRVAPLKSNQTRRSIFVPPTPGQAILVRAMVDPGNRVQESNERNNNVVSRH